MDKIIGTSPAVFQINEYLWLKNDYKPQVEAKIYHDNKNFFISFKVFEKNPLAKKTEHMAMVCEDSCVEWFVNFTPDSSDKYFNFEVNALGTMHAAYRKDRHEGEFLELCDIDSMDIQPNVLEDFWTVSYKIDFDLIKKYAPEFDIEQCSYIKMNLYKCGDLTQVPHYGACFKVGCENPDFHRPEYFGSVKVD